MTYQLRPAQRTASKPLIGLYGLSGSGKTYSALMLARGLVGANGRIGMIDTEAGRGQLYADVIPGGYDVLELGEFAPAKYIEALAAVEKSGVGVIVIDSASHEWEGVGGVLDLAATNELASGKAGLHNWKAPKMEHNKFVLALLRSPLPIIVCLRAKYRTRQGRDPQSGKTVIIKDDFTTPIQADDFIYEMTLHAELQPESHALRVTKPGHPAMAEFFHDGLVISEATGRALAQWASGDAAPASKTESAPTLLDRAKYAAAEGTARYREFFENEISKADRQELESEHAGLKAMAAKCDETSVQRDSET